MKPRSPKPPAGLSDVAKTLWRRVQDEYGISDPAGMALLESACRSMDRAAQAAALIEKHGVAVRDKFGQLKTNPACSVERDALAAFRGAMRDLHLDLEPLRDRPGRPSGT